MPKHDKPVLDVQAVRANRDHYRHWETRFHDYCLLEGYRNPAKNRTTETADHFIAAKRPFELAVLRSAIPASEWNTLDDVIASKIPTEDAEKPWIWLQHIKEHYVGASTLMQDRYHFWSKMSQATQTSISAWETTVRTAAGRCSFGVNADEFMRDKFLFGLNESFSRFREDIFYRDGQRKPDDPPFTLAFVVSQAISFEAAQHTNKLLANSTIEEHVHFTSSTNPNKSFQRPPSRPTRSGNYPNKPCFFCGSKQPHPREACPAQAQTCSYCHKTGHFANVCLQAARDHRTYKPTFQKPTPQGSRQEHVRMVEQEENAYTALEESIQYENCFTISSTADAATSASISLHSKITDKGHFVLLDLNDFDSSCSTRVPFQIDSAASCNTLPSSHLSNMPWAKILPSKTVILPYASPPIKPVGQVTLQARKGSSTCNLTFQVIDTKQPALLSTEASKRLGVLTLNADFVRKCSTIHPPQLPTADRETNTVSAAGPPPTPPDTSKRVWPQLGTLSMEFISKNCSSLFQGLGFLGPPVDFDLDPNVNPTHAPIHRQPISKLETIKAALDTYEATGQLIRVSQPTDWISNMVVREREPTPTKPGKIRICLDPSQTLNKAIRRPKYIIPTLEENLHKLHGMKYMTVIDVKEAFQNIPLTSRSSLMTTMFTPWGRYRWTRLPFGISSASEEWQRRIHIVLEELQVISIADDILIPGCGTTDTEARMNHDRNLIAVLERFEQHHVKLNLSKMKFLVRKATFMGHIITTDGLQPNPVTVQAILNMPTPKDKQGVRRFLGAINYLSKFCPQLSSVTQPMRNLTKEDTPFLWSAQHQQAFDEAKALATSAPCLAYYDVNAPVVLQVDASDYGLGAALLQPSKQHSNSTFDESSLQPIAYSSKSLTPTEQRYAQIEKECLAIVEAFNKFDQWLLGKSDITVHTDHQPLQSIFQKDLASAPKRLQKMMLCLQRYNFTVVYRKGSSLHLADTLSRAPYQDQATSPSVPDTFQVFQVHLAHLDPTSPALTDTTRKQLRRATTSCQDMQLLEHHIIHGWPPTKEHLPHQLQAFWHFRDELSVADGILLKSTRAIVPTSLRPNILNKIHQSHRGPEYCLRFARDAVFWPNMSKDIEAFCHSCPTCAQYGKQAPTEPMLSHPTPSGPWQLVSQDLFEFEHKHYLITVDHYSDFYELDQLTNTQSTTIVDLTKAHFARHGIPLRCLTDNGPQFISNEYKNFAQTYGFEHVTSSPYWSRSNGKAEATVNDAKSLLKKSHDISLALLNVRNTPPRGHSFSPTQRLMGRRTRSTLPLSADLLKPEPADPLTVSTEIRLRREASKAQYDKHAQAPLLPLPVGSHAYARPRPSHRGTPWLYGQVISSPTPRSYNIDTGSLVLRRNRAQLRPATAPQNIPRWILPPSQPLLADPPANASNAVLHKPDQPPPAAPLQAEGPIECLIDPGPQQHEQQTNTSPRRGDPQTPGTQQTTRSGRLIRKPKKFEDFSLY